MALGKVLCACVFVVFLTGGEAWWGRPAPTHPKYKVSVKVANEWEAGTNADVYVRLYGAYRQCHKGLDKSWHDDFERNSYETYELDCGSDLGRLSRVRIGHTNGGWWDDWKVSYVNVQDPHRGTTRYDANVWLRGGSAYRDLYQKVHGGWSRWTGWSTCDRSCGSGRTYRTRACNNPAPAHGGNQCYGSNREVRACYLRACPVNGGWGGWGNFGTCTASCGGGTQTRNRACDNPRPAHGGRGCTGPATETRRCNEQPCPVDGRWTSWSDYTVCTASCGGGTQERTRSCTNPAPAHGGADCVGDPSQSRECNTQHCPVDGGWTEFGEYGDCSVSCGGGTRQRSRSCTNPARAYGGADCQGPSVESESCNVHPCPIDGDWGDWGEYGDCSVSCGRGTKIRTRTCNNPEPAYGGRNCVGPLQELDDCQMRQCPVNGGWSEYGEFGPCSVSCGGGTQSRSRTCTNPAPAYGGLDCQGQATQSQTCGNDPCPIDGVWSDWVIGECSVSCGGGTLTKTRTCTNPAPAHGGMDCQGPATATESCGSDPCPVDGVWSDWVIGECSVSCGGGTLTKTRTCTNPAPAHGGMDCQGPATATESCGGDPCPVDGVWSDWVIGECSVSCGGGTQTKTRACNNPAPQHGGRDCAGPASQSLPCNNQPCRVDGGWSDWEDWGECTASCDGGKQYRERRCNNPEPAHGGSNCVGADREWRECGQEPCPDNNCSDRSSQCQRFKSRGFCHSNVAMMRKNCPKICGFC